MITLSDLANNITLDGAVMIRVYGEETNGDEFEFVKPYVDMSKFELEYYEDCEVTFLYALDDILYVEVKAPVYEYEVVVEETKISTMTVRATNPEAAKRLAREQLEKEGDDFSWDDSEAKFSVMK